MKKNISIFLIAFFFTSLSMFCVAQDIQKDGFAVSVNQKTTNAIMTKEEFKNATFGVHSYYPEFVDRVKLKGFSIKCPGFKTIVIEGEKLNKEAIECVEKLYNGDQIVVYNAISNSNGKYIIEIQPMIITINL